MPEMQRPPAQMPPEIAAYLRGVRAEGLQFEFLIGAWKAQGTRFSPTGEIMLKYDATWRAEYLHDKRMVLDDFSVLAPNGQELSSFVTLRTYAEATGRWEIAGIGALQPAMVGKWFGSWADGEMRLNAEATAPDGRIVLNRIRFFDIRPDSFSWESHNSFDGGATWVKAASLLAQRVQ